MPRFKFLEYGDNISEKIWCLWQYCKNDQALDDNGDILNFDCNKLIH